MKVFVLGCGPAGLLAAHAAALQGHEVQIYSRKVKSSIGGAQFLHMRIPGITTIDPDGLVEFIFRGTKEGYADKVYDDPLAEVSWGSYEPGVHPVWNMHAAYEKLWDKYEGLIMNMPLTAEFIRGMVMSKTGEMFSTIPAPALCRNSEHQFLKQEVDIIYGESTEVEYLDRRFENDLGDRNSPIDYIEYNGIPEVPYYRQSMMFGWSGTEYPADGSANGRGQAPVRVSKPLSTDCNCQPEIHRLGRYGRFEKKVLIHDAFFGAAQILADA
jgi:hypothetical protein